MSQIITTSQTGTGAVLYDVTAAGESFLVLPGVVLTNLGAAVISAGAGATDFHLTHYGTIASLGAVAVTSSGSRSALHFAAGSRVIADVAAQAAVMLAGQYATLTNEGEITATGTSALWTSALRSTVINWGSITGQKAAVVSDGLGSIFLNHGSITATATQTSQPVYAFHTRYEAQTLRNYGVMTAAGPGGAEVVHIVSPALRLDNHGLMTTGDGWVIGGQLGSGTTLRNWGTIDGADPNSGAVQLDAMANTLVNRGAILGMVDLGEGADTLDNRGGVVDGEVYGGMGDDVYMVSSQDIQIIEYGGDGYDSVISTTSFDLSSMDNIEALELRGQARAGTGNANDNLITGNSRNNQLMGLGGNDTLNGGEGNDYLNGGRSEDWLNGGDGNDSIFGGSGNDNVNGVDADDLLFGGAGIDTLYGGYGADTLNGGASRDRLYGGGDEDRFVYRQLSDSASTSAYRDQIFEFQAGLDQIDLSAIDAKPQDSLPGDQEFDWIGTVAFSSVAGQLRWQLAAGYGLLQADVTGDGLADFEIYITGLTSFAVNNLIL